MFEFSLELDISITEVAIAFVVSVVCYKVSQYIYSLLSSADNSNDEEHSSIESPSDVDENNNFDRAAARISPINMSEENVKKISGKKIEKNETEAPIKYRPQAEYYTKILEDNFKPTDKKQKTSTEVTKPKSDHSETADHNCSVLENEQKGPNLAPDVSIKEGNSHNQPIVNNVDIPEYLSINSLSASLTDLNRVVQSLDSMLDDNHQTQCKEDQNEAFNVLKAIFEHQSRWVPFVENSGLFSDFYSTLEKILKGLINEIYDNSLPLEVKKMNKNSFPIKSMVHDMSSFLNSFCEFLELLLDLVEDLSANRTIIGLNTIVGQWNQHIDRYKNSAARCLRYLQNANKKIEQRELSANISTLRSKTKEIIAHVQKNLRNISVKVSGRKKKTLKLIEFD